MLRRINIFHPLRYLKTGRLLCKNEHHASPFFDAEENRNKPLDRTTSSPKQVQLQEKVIRFERYKKIGKDDTEYALYDRTGETR